MSSEECRTHRVSSIAAPALYVLRGVVDSPAASVWLGGVPSTFQVDLINAERVSKSENEGISLSRILTALSLGRLEVSASNA